MPVYSRRQWWSGDYLDGDLHQRVSVDRRLLGSQLRELLGSFWQFFYKDDQEQVLAWLSAMGETLSLEAQQCQQALLFIASRYRCPPARQVYCLPWRVAFDEISREPRRYSDRGLFYGGAGVVYRNDSDDGYFCIPVPSSCRYVGMITNSLGFRPDVVWLEGVDFIFHAYPQPRILLRFDPRLEDWKFPRKVHINRPAVVLYLWNVATENRVLTEHWGRLLDLRPSRVSRSYGELVQAVLDGWAGGSSEEVILRLLSALMGVPLARAEERVIALSRDTSAKLVITDKSVYRVPLFSDILVSENDLLRPGDMLCDVIRVWSLGAGKIPTGVLDGLYLGAGFIRSPQYGGVFFPNKEVDITWSRQSGKWEARWVLEGDSRAIEQFWSDVRQREAKLGVSLAQLLTGRQDADELPRQLLPAKVNPSEWIIENLLRFHLVLVSVKLGTLDLPWPWEGYPPALSGPDVWSLLRNLLPPWESVLLIFELSRYDTITADLYASEQYDLEYGSTAGDSIDSDSAQERVAISYLDEECDDG